MGQRTRENRPTPSPAAGVLDELSFARRGNWKDCDGPRPSCSPVADLRQMTGRRAKPANTDGMAFIRSLCVTLHHNDPCHLVKGKKQLFSILTCRICRNFSLRPPAVGTPYRGHLLIGRKGASTCSPAREKGPLQPPDSTVVSLRKYLPGVTPRAFRKTDTKALRLLYPTSSAMLVTGSPRPRSLRDSSSRSCWRHW